MSRAYCYLCRRAKITCLCGRIDKQPNDIPVYVLQHPDETSNPKGSAIIAELGLKQYQCWVGEDFRLHEGLNELLSKNDSGVIVLYPADNAELLSDDRIKTSGENIKALLVLDGTWRKAKKIWELNPQLHKLPQYRLPQNHKTEYRIRKAPQEDYLSTLESIVAALRVIERSPGAYKPLLTLFTEMIDFQINKMGEQTYMNNYRQKK